MRYELTYEFQTCNVPTHNKTILVDVYRVYSPQSEVVVFCISILVTLAIILAVDKLTTGSK